MSKPRRHHFIPQMHLKWFVGQEPAGHVWTYEKVSGAVRSATTENTAVETHFYSAESENGVMDTRLEEALAKYEAAADPVYRALAEGHTPKTGSQGRWDFAMFLALMHCRTPAMRRMYAKLYSHHIQIHSYAYGIHDRAFEGLIARYEKEQGKRLSDEEKRKVRDSLLDPSGYVMEIPKEVTLRVLAVADELAPIFFRMNWITWPIRQGYLFTTDCPVVKQIDPKKIHPIYGDGGFQSRDAAVIFPLTPKRLLILVHGSTAPRQPTRDDVFRIRQVFAAHSDRYLYAHLKDTRVCRLAQQFKDDRPDMKTEGFGPSKFAATRVARRSKS